MRIFIYYKDAQIHSKKNSLQISRRQNFNFSKFYFNLFYFKCASPTPTQIPFQRHTILMLSLVILIVILIITCTQENLYVNMKPAKRNSKQKGICYHICEYMYSLTHLLTLLIYLFKIIY